MHGYFRLLLGTALGWRQILGVMCSASKQQIWLVLLVIHVCPHVLCACFEFLLCGNPNMLAFRGTLLLVALIGVAIHKVQDPHFVSFLYLQGKGLNWNPRCESWHWLFFWLKSFAQGLHVERSVGQNDRITRPRCVCINCCCGGTTKGGLIKADLHNDDRV